MLVAPVTVSLVAHVGPTTFVDWDVKGAIDRTCIWGVYASWMEPLSKMRRSC